MAGSTHPFFLPPRGGLGGDPRHGDERAGHQQPRELLQLGASESSAGFGAPHLDLAIGVTDLPLDLGGAKGRVFSFLLPLKNTTFQLFGGNMGYMSVKDQLPQEVGSFKG